MPAARDDAHALVKTDSSERDFADLLARHYQAATVATILALVAIRLVCAAAAPLSADEALYWIWSKHIAGGYLDHPLVNPVLIRIGTTLFGDTAFGVRVVGVLLALPASFAVWRAGRILFDDDRVGARAALYFNLTLALAVGSILATPDNPLLIATACLLLALAKLYQTGRGAWWLAVGLAFGVGLLSKYTMVFFAVSILVWLLLVARERKWLATQWPWLSAVIAIVVFSPTLIWNAQHHWASFLFHYHRRMTGHEWSPHYFADFFAAQVGMATPFVFVLGAMGLIGMWRGQGGTPSARVLVNAMVWPTVVYFTWHTLHDRVEGNWPEPIFVAFVIAAAVAVERIAWRGAWATLANISRWLAVPVALAIAAAIYVQALFGVVPLGPADPTAAKLGAGWRELGAQIDAIRTRVGAPVVLTTDYGHTGWLAFYLPSHPPVEQINGRLRYVSAPEPDRALFRGPVIYVCSVRCGDIPMLQQRFRTVELLETLPRSRRGVPIQEYQVYRLADPIGPPLDPP
jgi:4-amino-4-deoxy-L-arabinose transferase-like glycosyltransferase